MSRAMGISVHTGWAACLVVDGSPAYPEILSNRVFDILGDAERFCFHRAAQMPAAEAAEWIARLRRQAVDTARAVLAPALTLAPAVCAVVAKEGAIGELAAVLGSHPRIHSAEGRFYRDVLIEACPVQTRVIPPQTLDPARLGKLATRPWGRDQKLAALAAWRAAGVME